MTRIAILGSGRVATGLATKLASAGHDVVIGSRDPGAAETAWQGGTVAFADVATAAADAEIVVNATPGDSAVERLGALREQLAGKILVDVSNAVTRGEITRMSSISARR